MKNRCTGCTVTATTTTTNEIAPMADLPPNINWLREAAEKCKTGKRIAIPLGGEVFYVRVSKHDPTIHGERPDFDENGRVVATDGGEE